jgi:predicted nucleic acid-binding protein
MFDQREDGGQFVSPALLLAEVAGAISRRTRPDLAQRALHELETLPGLRMVEMSNSLLTAAAHLAADLGLRGADSVYVATAVQLRVPLLTLDIDQKARASAVVKIFDL